MVKTTSSEMDTHLDGEVTNLTTCWRIDRVDGTQFFFTDHDIDIPFGGDIYLATTGYRRTSIKADPTLAVNTMDLSGIFDSALITEQDIRAGLYDFAEVRLFVVSWDDLTRGDIKVHRGLLGEVNITQQGFFEAELRGMTQYLAQRIVDLYQEECRVDLGSLPTVLLPGACHVPIDPPTHLLETAYAVGDFVKVFEPPKVVISGTNMGAEVAPGAEWVNDLDTLGRDNSDTAPEGTFYFQNLNSTDCRAHQDLTLPGGEEAQTDLGNRDCLIVWEQSNVAAGADTARMEVEFFDGGLASLGARQDAALLGSLAGFTTRAFQVVMPALTRTIRVFMFFDRITGNNSGEIDDIRVWSVDNTPPLQEDFNNLIFEAIIAGTSSGFRPTFDSTPGNTTVDGTVTWRTHEAWMRDAVVATVTDNAIFTITVTESRDVDDWFNEGALIWDDGNNTGKSIEIRDWANGTATITLFLPCAYDVQVGDKLKLYPGCDKRRVQCRDKFQMPNSLNFVFGNVINFQGNPDIPGQDQIAFTPDSKPPETTS